MKLWSETRSWPQCFMSWAVGEFSECFEDLPSMCHVLPLKCWPCRWRKSSRSWCWSACSCPRRNHQPWAVAHASSVSLLHSHIKREVRKQKNPGWKVAFSQFSLENGDKLKARAPIQATRHFEYREVWVESNDITLANWMIHLESLRRNYLNNNLHVAFSFVGVILLDSSAYTWSMSACPSMPLVCFGFALKWKPLKAIEVNLRLRYLQSLQQERRPAKSQRWGHHEVNQSRTVNDRDNFTARIRNAECLIEESHIWESSRKS